MKWYIWLAIAVVVILLLYVAFGKKKTVAVKPDGSLATQDQYNFDPYKLTLIK